MTATSRPEIVDIEDIIGHEPPPPSSPEDYGGPTEARPERKSAWGRASPRFPLLPFHRIEIDTNRRAYLIKGLIASTGLTVVWGAPKCGKSFWAMDVALHVALGWEYRGRRVQKCPVIYVALEGQHGMAARIEAFRRHHRVTAAPFFLVLTRLNLAADADALVTDIKTQVGDTMPGLVVIDTLNRSLVGSESKDEDMAKYLAAADLVGERLGAAVAIVHHCGIDATRPRGHTSLTGSVESQIAVKRGDAGEVIATVECAKDFAEGAEICSRLEQVTVGTDPDGDDITTLVVLPAERHASTGAKVKGAKKVALDILRKAIDEAGEPAPASKCIPPNTRTISMETWRRCAYAAGITESDDPDTRRKAFGRAATALQAANLIGKWKGYVWIA